VTSVSILLALEEVCPADSIISITVRCIAYIYGLQLLQKTLHNLESWQEYIYVELFL